jgi:hypothetical protein
MGPITDTRCGSIATTDLPQWLYAAELRDDLTGFCFNGCKLNGLIGDLTPHA